ncbi:FAD synthase [Candidatus Woesearchaeota archaeon]|nr:MAG: FAD synthase [Candidatus Woesearchaeota archaeon]
MKKKIVMAFGAFDGVHTGHIHYLKTAKKLGTKLIVAIARDKAPWKFSPHYHLPENERKKLIEELGIADKVVLGGITSAFEKIEQIKPDLIAISSYTPVDNKILQDELKKRGLHTKVVQIKPYKKHLFDKFFAQAHLEGMHKMGLRARTP